MRRSQKLDWSRLPGVILSQLKSLDYLREETLEHRGTTVYASTHPRPTKEDIEQERWLRFKLDQLAGYTVKFSQRQLQKGKCSQGHVTSQYVEKGVDTKIACDMLASAIRDSYDIGIVISNDADLIPSIECVQDVLDKRIVHAGLGDACQYIRSAAWAHIALSGCVSELLQPANSRPSVSKAGSADGTMREAFEDAMAS